MKYCKICKRETPHNEDSHHDGCKVCQSANIVVKKICDEMKVKRQAVYAKADRKGFGRRYEIPPAGRPYRVFTTEEADVLINEDGRRVPGGAIE